MALNYMKTLLKIKGERYREERIREVITVTCTMTSIL